MDNALNVLIIGRIHPAGPALLAERSDFAVTEIEQRPADLLEHIKTADAVIVRTARIGASVIEEAPRLRIVCRHGVGYDNVDVPALTARGIPLATVGNANALTVAEHTLHMMLMLSKRALQWQKSMRGGDWQWQGMRLGNDLSGRTILIVGMGRIGMHVARLSRAFGMSVLVHDPYVGDDAIAAAEGERAETLEAGLAAADFVTLHAPLSDATRAMIGAAELALMPKHAVLLNAARGGLVDEAALVDALENGIIGGAGIDVFEQEPTPADNRLRRLDNVVLSPHIAGITEECMARMSLACARNVIDFVDGGTLADDVLINPEALA